MTWHEDWGLQIGHYGLGHRNLEFGI